MRKEWKMRGSVKGNSSADNTATMRRRVRGISIGNACQFFQIEVLQMYP